MSHGNESAVPEISLADPEVLRDPFAAHRRAREQAPLARLLAPGFGSIWLVTRYQEARAALGDERFALTADSMMRAGIPEDLLPYLVTMSHMPDPDHARLRRLVSSAFGSRRIAALRPWIEQIADELLDQLPDHAEEGSVDLLRHYAQPLPITVVCELLGIPATDHQLWRDCTAALAAGPGPGAIDAIRTIVDSARSAIALRRREPGDNLISDLIRAQDEDPARVSETEMVTLVWNLVIGGQENPANLIANAVAALLTHPDQLALLRADPALMPRAIQELMRWCGPGLQTIPRYATEDVELDGQVVRKGEPIAVALASANRDERVFADPDRLDITRAPQSSGQLGFGHGRNYCLGRSLAETEVETALGRLLTRWPGLALAVAPEELPRVPDPGAWRLAALPVTL
ncbi:cytochrome P450 [Actinoplanes missouriensis]|uniref:cytochrome P450 family protein n=1 Tax=Actinoplanes missouriensis TaxID=1866 RepID=UPI0033E3D1DA